MPSDAGRGAFAGGGHLPNNRGDRPPADPYGLPRQRRGTTPQMHGRFPDYDVLEHAEHWDPVTCRTVLARLDPPGPLRHFEPVEAAALERLLDVVLAQDSEPRIPVLAVIDARLAEGRGVGYRHADMPADGELWQRVARGLDEAARAGGAPSFAQASRPLVERIVRTLADGTITGDAWDGLDLGLTWAIIGRDAVDAFYRHPWAWNEIGFAGPAYPRGQMRLARGEAGAEPHEGREAFSLDAARDVRERGR